MIKVTVEGPTGEGVIWEGSMQAVPTAGDIVCIGEVITYEVRSVFYDLNDGSVLIRAR